MNPDVIFKAYDIRGRTDTGELDASVYESVGSALVELLAAPVVAIGYDCRETSRGFFDAMALGVMSTGADVVDLGEVPTDAVYYYSGSRAVPGAMITASHNPPEYNGLKLCRAGAAPIGSGTGLDEIKRMVVENRPGRSDHRQGQVRKSDIVTDYVDHLFSIVAPASVSRLKVAVDGGNGMAGVAINQVFDRIEAEMVGLYLNPDGTFPNHPADPLVPENLADLQELMSEGGFDLGVAFDGDADRAFFLDDVGVPLSGSTVTSLIARQLLRSEPGATVVHNLITSRSVPEIVAEAGGKPIRTRVGHSYIKAVMAETGALFGGEHSGHYYFRENFRADSGMLAMLVLLSVLSVHGIPLSELRTEVERYEASGEVNFRVVDPERSIADVESAYSDADLDRLDGLTVDTGDGWFNVRASNTEPLLRLNAEADTKPRVEQLVDAVRSIVEER